MALGFCLYYAYHLSGKKNRYVMKINNTIQIIIQDIKVGCNDYVNSKNHILGKNCPDICCQIKLLYINVISFFPTHPVFSPNILFVLSWVSFPLLRKVSNSCISSKVDLKFPKHLSFMKIPSKFHFSVVIFFSHW